MKKLLTILSLSVVTVASNAQIITTVLKPNATIGEDALVAFSERCRDWTAGVNPNSPELLAMSWTYADLDCDSGIFRTLLRFSELNSIPTGALVTGVTLNLYGVNASVNVTPGNSGYPVSPHATDNEILIRRVTSPWSEGTVTWGGMPTTTTVNQITTPASSSRWNWNYSNSSPELLNMVQDMINDPTQNFGFMLQLNNEHTRRSMLFASSDHPDSTLWPELIVTYEICNPEFSITTSSSSNGIFTFTSPVNDPSASHYWTYSGPSGSGPLGSVPMVGITFTQGGTYTICHMLTLPETKCSSCIDICTNGFIANLENRPASENKEEQRTNVSLEQPGMINATPNPTGTDWAINFTSKSEDRVLAIIIDMQNKIVFEKMINVDKGENTLKIDGINFASGQYILKLSLDGTNRTVKMIKY